MYQAGVRDDPGPLVVSSDLLFPCHLTPQVSILNRFSEAIRGNLTKIMRLKIVALVTIEIHARDVLEKLYKSGLMDVYSFDWLSQLRFYWEKVPLGRLSSPLP